MSSKNVLEKNVHEDISNPLNSYSTIELRQ